MGPPGAGNFKSSKGKIIGLIVAGVVGIGVLGAIAALVFAGGDEAKPSATPGQQETGILEPTPIGNVDPPPADPTTEPTPEPTAEPTPEPTAEPTTEPAPDPDPPSGDTVTIGNGVVVSVPDGWEVAGSGENDVALTTTDGAWAYVVAGQVDPSSDAASVIIGSLESVLPPDNYSQLRTSDIQPLEPFGSVVSLGVTFYDATWVDAQSSVPLAGQLYGAVRQDGTALIIAVEVSPPEELESRIDVWAPVVDNTLNLFGAS